jgi:hypothetical protein
MQETVNMQRRVRTFIDANEQRNNKFRLFKGAVSRKTGLQFSKTLRGLLFTKFTIAQGKAALLAIITACAVNKLL